MNTRIVRHAISSLLPAITASVMAACNSIATIGAPITSSLDDGRSGTVAFTSVTPRSTWDFLSHSDISEKAVISGELSMPDNGPHVVPAVIILHGSSGVNKGERDWAQRMNALGYASFVVDSFTGRGIKNTEEDQTQLPMTADIADGYAALRLLATDPHIDKDRIAVMGFSRGGVAALYSTLEPFRLAATEGDLRFAAHVAFYPSCGISYDAEHLDDAPVLVLVGGKDDYTPAEPCINYVATLRSKGAQVTLKEYPNAWHGFDRSTPLHPVPFATSARECHGSYDLDSGRFTMVRDGRVLTGTAAVAESKRCLTTGVILGGDPEARAQSPIEVAAFLKTAFK